MDREKRVLYIAISIILFLFGLELALLKYKYGIAEGELKQMNLFKDKFMPDPKNVFPDAAPVDLTGEMDGE